MALLYARTGRYSPLANCLSASLSTFLRYPISPSNEAIVETNFALCPFLLPLFLSILLDRARPLSPPSLSSFAREMIERKDFAGEGKKFVSKRIRQIPRGSLLENGGISG